MASISITVPDSEVTRIEDAFDETYPGRTDAGLTKGEWVSQWMREYVKSITVSCEAMMAADAARAAKIAEVEAAIG